MKLHSLLIGINEYQSPNVNNLSGCTKDVEKMRAFIEGHFGENAVIHTLLDTQATKANIIKAFETDLQQAQAGDSIFIYYSGHGSTEKTMLFGEYENQTIVCHDSRTEGVYDLADKELAVLIDKLPKNTHIVLCFDSCHSGSITREGDNSLLLRKRHTADDKSSRTLDTYYGYATNKPLHIPDAPHIVLSACDSSEVAWENNEGGIFTHHLLKTLANYPQQMPSYAKLFRLVQIGIRQTFLNSVQSPQLAKGNAHTYFLTGESAEREDILHTLSYNPTKTRWEINSGALQGIVIPENNAEKSLQIYEGEALLGEASIEKLNLDTTLLKGLPADLDTQKKYTCLQKPLKEAQNIALWIADENIRKEIPQGFLQVSQKEQADYGLQLTEGWYEIYEVKSEKLLTETKTEKQALDVLKQIATWQHLYKLENKGTQFKTADFEIQWKTKEKALLNEAIAIQHQESLDYFLENIKEEIPYEVIFKNNTNQNLYVALLCITPLYGIYPLGYANIGANETHTLYDSGGLIFLEGQEEEAESNILFKVLISKISFNHEDIHLEHIVPPKRGKREEAKPKMPSNKKIKVPPLEDWTCHDIFVNLYLKPSGQTLEPNTPLQLSENLTITSANISAEVSLSQSYSGSKGLSQENPWQALRYIEGASVQVLGNQSRGAEASDLIFLNNIQGEINEANPLKIELNSPLDEDEYILPMGYDGEHFIPIGFSDTENPSSIFIEQIPENQDQNKSRNVGRALKFCLMKIKAKVFGQTLDSVFLLRKVTATGKELYEDKLENIKKAVSESQKILLVIHGIIGNTSEMAELARAFLAQKQYDCVLAFDYENLNTPIEGIASELKTRLKDIGISENKKIDILAHSMGGLVSRYWIEKDGGNVLANQLIMCGTPNGGSFFGRIDTYRKYLSIGASIAGVLLNPAHAVAWVGSILGISKAIKSITGSAALATKTLEQMNKGKSDFLKQLNEAGNDGKIPYFIVAGNLHDYKDQALTDKVYRLIGNFINSKAPNDIAVLTEDIKVKGQNTQVTIYDVPCHHLNYFSESASTEVLLKILTT